MMDLKKWNKTATLRPNQLLDSTSTSGSRKQQHDTIRQIKRAIQRKVQKLAKGSQERISPGLNCKQSLEPKAKTVNEQCSNIPTTHALLPPFLFVFLRNRFFFAFEKPSDEFMQVIFNSSENFTFR